MICKIIINFALSFSLNTITYMPKKYLLSLVVIIFCLLSSCRDNGYKYHIGLSQCVGGAWREKVNQEMLSAQHLYNNVVKVDIANADNSSERQVKQIDSLVVSGIDLLVVAPNDYETVAPAIVRARKKGIPVVLFDRKVDTKDYTAYIGGDNIEAGSAMGHYVLSLIRERRYDHIPRILEITGGTTSSPAIDRHKGFSSVIKGVPGVEYSFINTDWTPEQTYKAMQDYLKSHPTPDIVFCHSDLAAFNARKAYKDVIINLKPQISNLQPTPLFLGIDGLPGKGEGIDAVDKGILAGTYIYPTHGEQIVKLALDILQKKPYKRDNIMKSIIVTPDNAPVILQSSEEMEQRNKDLFTLQGKIENLFGIYNTQRTLIVVGAIAIVLLVAALILIWRVVIITRKVNRKEKQLNEEQTLFYTNARHQLRTPLTLIEGPLNELADSKELKGRDRSLVDILQRNVRQLSKIVYDVLQFRNETPPAVDDSNAATELDKETSKESVRQGRAGILTNENEGGLPTVLIVDDNADMRRYLRTLLTDKYYVTEAADGESGLKLANESIPDLIVSDVMMPVMDGLQFCKKIKEDAMTSHIPVILLTARSTESQQVEGLESGADAYLTKPFSAQLLLARIDNLLKSRQQLRHLFDGKAKEESQEEKKLSAPDRTFIDRLKAAIQKHLAESDLKMDDLGAELGISRVQLYRKVKALTGLSPVELLRQTRLQKAYSLLETTGHTVSEIAYDTGFSSPGYFTTCFKKQYGKSPMEVRQ